MLSISFATLADFFRSEIPTSYQNFLIVILALFNAEIKKNTHFDSLSMFSIRVILPFEYKLKMFND